MIDRPPMFAVYRGDSFLEVTPDTRIYQRVPADTMSNTVRKDQFLLLPVDNMPQAIRLLERMVEKGKVTDPLVIAAKQLLAAMKVNVNGASR